MPKERLTIGQTATGYWVVQRGSVDVAGAPTRKAAEAECALRERLRSRDRQRARRLRGRARESVEQAVGGP